MLLGVTAVTILVISIQIGMQFIQSYKFIGFVKRDQSTWIGIAETAQADNQTCQAQLEDMKKIRNNENADILK